MTRMSACSRILWSASSSPARSSWIPRAARRPTGDLISVGLRPGFEEYDFAIPFILREQVEALEDTHIDPSSLEPFGSFSLQQLKGQIGQGEKFNSEDVQAKTRFGDYRVHGGVMTATGYNDYLARITRRITEAVTLTDTTNSSKAFANASKFPYIQINRAEMAEGIDTFIRRHLFGQELDPLADENWRVLLIDRPTSPSLRDGWSWGMRFKPRTAFLFYADARRDAARRLAAFETRRLAETPPPPEEPRELPPLEPVEIPDAPIHKVD